MFNMLLRIFMIGFVAVALTACGKRIEEEFRQTQPGKALYSCVSGSGKLEVTKGKSRDGKNVVDAYLVKGKRDALLTFVVDPDLKQAELIDAAVSDGGKVEDNQTRLSLMLHLELMCGGESASMMMPDAYNALRLMGNVSRMMNR